MRRSGVGSAAEIQYLAEVMRRYYADRSQYLGDPDFGKLPVSELLEPAYIQRGATPSIRITRRPARSCGPGLLRRPRRQRDHALFVVDAQGNAVAVTYTLNEGYGNGITVPGLGFLLNDEMDDFTSKPGSPNVFGLIQGEPTPSSPANGRFRR